MNTKRTLEIPSQLKSWKELVSLHLGWGGTKEEGNE